MQRLKCHASIVELGITNTVGEYGIPSESLAGVFMVLFSRRIVFRCDLKENIVDELVCYGFIP